MLHDFKSFCFRNPTYLLSDKYTGTAHHRFESVVPIWNKNVSPCALCYVWPAKEGGFHKVPILGMTSEGFEPDMELCMSLLQSKTCNLLASATI